MQPTIDTLILDDGYLSISLFVSCIGERRDDKGWEGKAEEETRSDGRLKERRGKRGEKRNQ